MQMITTDLKQKLEFTVKCKCTYGHSEHLNSGSELYMLLYFYTYCGVSWAPTMHTYLILKYILEFLGVNFHEWINISQNEFWRMFIFFPKKGRKKKVVLLTLHKVSVFLSRVPFSHQQRYIIYLFLNYFLALYGGKNSKLAVKSPKLSCTFHHQLLVWPWWNPFPCWDCISCIRGGISTRIWHLWPFHRILWMYVCVLFIYFGK